MPADPVRMETKQNPYRVFVPRWMDQTNTNAQNSNARAMLSRFSDPRARWIAVRGEEAAEGIRRNPAVETHCISTSRLWPYQLFLKYQSKCDAIFYPGPSWADKAGFVLRRLTGRNVPAIATFEGVIAGQDDLSRLSQLVGHPVFAQPGADAAVPRIRWMYETCAHIIAISPFLARVATTLYGDKVSCLSLGMEGKIFHDTGRRDPARCKVVGCGTVKRSKKPEFFLRLASRYRQADFVWFGDGAMRQALILEAKKMGLNNLAFPGAVSPEVLAEQFRSSSFLVLPSQAEGVPKVTQEAAACGLPIVLYGFYEAPSVVHRENGLVAWSEEELLAHVGVLIENREMRFAMGRRGAEMARGWNWDDIAPRWEDLLIRLVAQYSRV
jgi:glycosyltransferase involved in cell wall biosynthesis